MELQGLNGTPYILDLNIFCVAPWNLCQCGFATTNSSPNNSSLHEKIYTMNYHNFSSENSAINVLRLVENTSFALTGGSSLRLNDLSDEKSSPLVFTRIRNSLFAIDCLDVSTNTEFFVAGSKDTLCTFDLVKRIEIEGRVLPHRDQPLGCSILNDSLIGTVGANHKLYLFDLRQPNAKAPIFAVNLGNDNLNCISTNLGQLAVGSSNGCLYSVDLKMGTVTTDNIGDSINSIDTKDNTKLLTTSGASGLVKLVNDKGVVEQEILTSNTGNFKLNAKFARDCIINGTDVGNIQIWQYSTGFKLVKQLAVESNTSAGLILNDVEYDELANRLVSCSGDGVVHVWEGLL